MAAALRSTTFRTLTTHLLQHHHHLSTTSSWPSLLRPGFTPSDVITALQSQPDPDLALDLFRWTSLQPHYRHTSAVYHTMLTLSLSSRRLSHAYSLLSDLLAGAVPSPSLPLLNASIRFCCSRKDLFSSAFDVFNLILKTPTKPNLETFSLLLSAVVRHLDRSAASLSYMHSVRSLVRHMKASGVVPDTFVSNLIIKAHSRCLEMVEAVRVFKEMGLYCCEPNEFTYGYLVRGMCEKGRVEEGLRFYKEMRGKELVPRPSVYMVVVNCLSMERRFEEAMEVIADMVENKVSPDMLTCRTLVEGLGRDGRVKEGFDLLEMLKRVKAVDDRTYANLVDGLNWICKDFR